MARRQQFHLLAIFPVLTTGIFLLPVAFGLIGTWLPAFGYFPAIDMSTFSLQPWLALFQHPSFASALQKTLLTGIGASLLALAFTFLILMGSYPSRFFQRIERWLSPILSVPHAAFAIGISYLVTPSGWLVRWVNAAFQWFPVPPTWTTFQDPLGLSLLVTLALKEMPFLLFMSLAVLPSLKASKTLWLSKSMGNGARFAWLWLLFPQLYQQIKLPFFAVVAFSLTVVDVAMIAGPTTPPTLAVLITQLFDDPDLTQRTVGAAGATALLLLVLLILMATQLVQWPLRWLRGKVLRRGRIQSVNVAWERVTAYSLAIGIGVIYLLSAMTTFLWSFAQRWRYPDILPSEFSLRAWGRVFERIAEPFRCTLLLAALSASIALVLVVLALENEVRLRWQRERFDTGKALWLIYLPLLVPQIAFLFGFQVWLIQLNWDAQFLALLWSHLVFVVPYVFLTLSGPYRQFDDRYFWQALSLRQARWPAYWRIKFPILLRPLLYAFATGFAVSIAQFLPTLFIGAGQFTTITTEAVAMASGSDRRMTAVLALWQQLLPLAVFALATLIPAIRFRSKRAMQQQ